MGTLTIPNLETSMQKHREHLDFAIQSNQVWDAILFAQLINELLPRNNQLFCSSDKGSDCVHIRFALMLSALGRIVDIRPKRE